MLHLTWAGLLKSAKVVWDTGSVFDFMGEKGEDKGVGEEGSILSLQKQYKLHKPVLRVCRISSLREFKITLQLWQWHHLNNQVYVVGMEMVKQKSINSREQKWHKVCGFAGWFIPLVVEYRVFIMFCKWNPASLLLRRQNVEIGATISKTVLDLKN